jgi:hypothetical protein
MEGISREIGYYSFHICFPKSMNKSSMISLPRTFLLLLSNGVFLFCDSDHIFLYLVSRKLRDELVVCHGG